MKDWVINLTVVLADGTVIKTKRRPRYNIILSRDRNTHQGDGRVSIFSDMALVLECLLLIDMQKIISWV